MIEDAGHHNSEGQGDHVKSGVKPNFRQEVDIMVKSGQRVFSKYFSFELIIKKVFCGINPCKRY